MASSVSAAIRVSKRIIGNHSRNLCHSCVKLSQHENTGGRTKEFGHGETHFGFETIKEDEKSSKVHDVFETVASSYDVMNDLMSLRIHRIWKDVFMQRLSPSPGTKLLDVAGGTGDVAFRFIKYLKHSTSTNKLSKPSHVTIADINEHMLNVGKSRAEKFGVLVDAKRNNVSVDWLEADAEKLPLEDNTYDAYTIAFGVRNVTHIDKVISEAYRVLRPGGRFLCLEFSRVENPYLKWVYDQYSFQVIPVMGQLVVGQWKPYEYLVGSIRQFPPQEEFKDIILSAGFRRVAYENLTFGIVAIHSGFKL